MFEIEIEFPIGGISDKFEIWNIDSIANPSEAFLDRVKAIASTQIPKQLLSIKTTPTEGETYVVVNMLNENGKLLRKFYISVAA